jgi:hypothetical protein
LATRLVAVVGALGDGLSRVTTRLAHLNNPGVLAILCVTALTAVQHIWRAAKRAE